MKSPHFTLGQGEGALRYATPSERSDLDGTLQLSDQNRNASSRPAVRATAVEGQARRRGRTKGYVLPGSAWGAIQALLAERHEPMSRAQITAMTGRDAHLVSVVLSQHRADLLITGKRCLFRYQLKKADA